MLQPVQRLGDGCRARFDRNLREHEMALSNDGPFGEQAHYEGTTHNRSQVGNGERTTFTGAVGRAPLLDRDEILKRITGCSAGLQSTEPARVAALVMSGCHAAATERDVQLLLPVTAASLIQEDPEYSLLAARLLAAQIKAELHDHGIWKFSQWIALGHGLALINHRLYEFVTMHADELDGAIRETRDREFEYFGIRTLYDRYLLRHPTTRSALEAPQYLFMRVACALSQNVSTALELYEAFSTLSYLPSSPTLFNAGTDHEQLSSCFLLDSPQDSLDKIYARYADIALLSKFSGGVGLAYHRVRSRGSLISSLNRNARGIIPWLKTLDASVAAVSQAGRRKGACCVYLETWHADIEAFLELRDGTGDEASRTHNLNVANWVPDLFMRRVEANAEWSLFDPKDVPGLPDVFGEQFERLYEEAELSGRAVKVVKARNLYARMMRTLAQTGNGWITFKDKSNIACNQTAEPGNVVHHSNLCTEILEVTSEAEVAVCNLASINLARHTEAAADGSLQFNFEKLARTVRTAVRQLDGVIDLNYYALPEAQHSNLAWRPLGLGLMGLQDVFFQFGWEFDGDEARALSAKISEEVYFHALSTSLDLGLERGAHPSFHKTRAARGELSFDSWRIRPSAPDRWNALKKRICENGLRNSLLIAIAPTATIASVAGCYECIEPQVSNMFKRETASGDFLQLNGYLVKELKSANLWNESTRQQLKLAEGSVQGIAGLPEATRKVYRTAWEVPMRSLIDMAADRGPFIDQSQSLNLFIESPTIARLSSMYYYAWKKGLKTTYYLRSRPATRIAKATVALGDDGSLTGTPGAELELAASAIESPARGAASCALEDPEGCEACQ
jgi:ribonucleoside-diphosphate reductase alpha chain